MLTENYIKKLYQFYLKLRLKEKHIYKLKILKHAKRFKLYLMIYLVNCLNKIIFINLFLLRECTIEIIKSDTSYRNEFINEDQDIDSESRITETTIESNSDNEGDSIELRSSSRYLSNSLSSRRILIQLGHNIVCILDIMILKNLNHIHMHNKFFNLK